MNAFFDSRLRPGSLRCTFALAVVMHLALSSPAATDIPANRPAARPAGTNAAPRLDYDSFSLITSRNIFNPHRSPTYKPTTLTTVRPTARVDSFALVGTMAYEKGTFAFFDGASSEYRRVLTNSDVIAGYKITSVEPNLVKLTSGTNEFQMAVGMQLRRENRGAWHLAAATESDFGSGSGERRSFRSSRGGTTGGITTVTPPVPGGPPPAEGDDSNAPLAILTPDSQAIMAEPGGPESGGTNAVAADPNENPVLRALRLRREQEDGR